MKLFLLLSLAWSSLIVSGCQSSGGTRLTEQNVSLNEIRAAISKVIGDFRRVSENQRDFYSQYYSPSEESKFDANKSNERAFVKFTIYGDRRPYDIEAKVVIEQRQEGLYLPTREDLNTAKDLLHQLKQNLNKSLEKRNIIDDFRAF
jgi:hypothetical protein